MSLGGELRDHQRAISAHAHVARVHEETAPKDRKGPDPSTGDAPDDRPDKRRRKYGSMCHRLPVLVHTSGLAQALHFAAARRDPWQTRILDDLAVQLEEAGLLGAGHGKRAELLRAAREADLAEVQALSREVQRCLLWYKRFAESILRVSAADEDADDAPDGSGTP